ncbi:hypothetical protein [Psychrobacter sanguinis]|uniref:hypothetical protein n=1 Tax=Psychrobacter sanguinis TaxID=861445 RepID=UPI002A7560F2|nr:hypothetical protein [Psychrobacter sanguinis]MDY3306543.1 hypothetical protein [Psychrobacter sanguinis]
MALRTPLSVTPHLYMGDSTGRPLDKGVVYFGEQDKDPEFYPINLFSDDALTKPLAQPVHTKGGYLYDKGDMVEPHAKELIYSVKVLDSYGRKVFYKGAMMRNSWNDDVIEQINTAIIGSADVARQVATDITNDAINNTAIEGGVLADTLVVVDGSLSQRTINKGLESIADLSTIKNPKDGLRVYVKSYHAGFDMGGGYFTYDSSKASINDKGNIINGWVRQASIGYFNVQHFGALGLNDDTDYRDHNAFNAVTKAIENYTGNQIYIHIPRPVNTYIVGRQSMGDGEGGPYLSSEQIIEVVGKGKSVHVHAEQARMRIRNGLRYGVFNVTDNTPYTAKQTQGNSPHRKNVYVSNLGHMFNFHEIDDLIMTGSYDLNGNREGQLIGGGWGDTAWQLPASGIHFIGVKRYYIENVQSHHHCWDGVYVAGWNYSDTPDLYDNKLKGVLNNVHCDANSRQGVSLCGGQNITFNDCTFSNTGLPSYSVASLPCQGVDIEPERFPVRKVVFNSCGFLNNRTQGLAAIVGDSKDVTCNDCTFVGIPMTVWIDKPKYTFNNCHFNGKIEQLHNNQRDDYRTKFNDCTFEYNPAGNPLMPSSVDFLVSGGGRNPIFINCNFDLENSGFVFDDYTFSEANPEGTTMLNCVVNVYDTTGGILMRGGPYINTTFKDFRTDPTPYKGIEASGISRNTKILSMTPGVKSGLANYNTVKSNSSFRILMSSPEEGASVFEYKGLVDSNSRSINGTSLPKVSYNHILTPVSAINGMTDNVGDRIYCTDPAKNIDYWVCVKAGTQDPDNKSEWKAINAVAAP